MEGSAAATAGARRKVTRAEEEGKEIMMLVLFLGGGRVTLSCFLNCEKKRGHISLPRSRWTKIDRHVI